MIFSSGWLFKFEGESVALESSKKAQLITGICQIGLDLNAAGWNGFQVKMISHFCPYSY